MAILSLINVFLVSCKSVPNRLAFIGAVVGTLNLVGRCRHAPNKIGTKIGCF